ncbi:MAG: hypothetical protein U5R49_20725 [Deltaproteobacteria bacterium]|nr:hypothetical protein [Deltaproteobacteria bacterium]
MTEGANKNTPYMAPGLIRDKVADRFAGLNPSIRTTPLSGRDLRDQISRTLLKEAHGLYTQWQHQDTEGILRKSADTLEVILAGLKQHGLDQTDLIQTRQERLNMLGSLVSYLSNNPESGLCECGKHLNSMRYLF